MAIDIEEQYEKIYRYCYYRLRNRELVLLRCVNETPMAVLCKLYGVSRFALRRRLNDILKTLWKKRPS